MDNIVGDYKILIAINYIKIVEYLGLGERVNIPSFLGPLPVTFIGDYAFFNSPNLTSVTIPSSVIFIGYYAFMDCHRLKSVTIPSGVTRHGVGAFPSHTVITRI